MTDFRPDQLIKYCTAHTGLNVLSTGSLRWSSPKFFNDPLSLDDTTELPFTPERLKQATVQAAVSLIFAKEPPRGSSPIHTAIRRWRDEERFASPEEAEEVMEGLLAQVVDQRNQVLEELLSSWKTYTRSLRICCFSAKPDIGHCWNHYAEQHQGIAIRFDCDNSDTFPSLHKIRYQRSRPAITTLNEQLQAIIEQQNAAPDTSFEDCLTASPEYAREEREWRAFRHAGENAEPCLDLPFDAEDVRAVYLGLQTTEAVEQQIRALKKERYRHAKLFRATLPAGRYQVEFERI